MLQRIGSFLNLIIVREVDERDVAIDPFAWIIQTIQIGIHFRPRQFIESCGFSGAICDVETGNAAQAGRSEGKGVTFLPGGLQT